MGLELAMPKPLKNEKKSEYIGRCVKQVMKEGKTQKQALGQCYGMWEQYKSKAFVVIALSDDEIICVPE